MSKPKRKDDNIVSLDELKEQGAAKEIKDIKDLTFSTNDFVIEKDGRFRDHYQIGSSLGT